MLKELSYDMERRKQSVDSHVSQSAIEWQFQWKDYLEQRKETIKHLLSYQKKVCEACYTAWRGEAEVAKHLPANSSQLAQRQQTATQLETTYKQIKTQCETLEDELMKIDKQIATIQAELNSLRRLDRAELRQLLPEALAAKIAGDSVRIL